MLFMTNKRLNIVYIKHEIEVETLGVGGNVDFTSAFFNTSSGKESAREVAGSPDSMCVFIYCVLNPFSVTRN